MTLFLDVDGVLSPLRGPSTAWDDWEEVPFNEYYLLLSRDMADAIDELSVRIVWLTTWRDLANSHICSWLDCEDQAVVVGGGEIEPAVWKAGAVRDHVLDGGGPFVWIDDNLDDMVRLIEPALVNHRHLLLQPDPYVGLTRSHLDQVERFTLGIARSE